MSNPTGQRSIAWPMTVLTSLFFMWGFLTVMNDVLVPHWKEAFQLSYAQSLLVQFCFFGAYFLGSMLYYFSSLSGADPIQRFGYKRAAVGGLLLSATACLLFIPASYSHSYSGFLLALFMLGLGFTLLQIAANPFVAIIGSAARAAAGRTWRRRAAHSRKTCRQRWLRSRRGWSRNYEACADPCCTILDAPVLHDGAVMHWRTRGG